MEERQPEDWILFVYNYLAAVSNGEAEPEVLTDTEIKEIRGFKQKIEFLRSQLGEGDIMVDTVMMD